MAAQFPICKTGIVTAASRLCCDYKAEEWMVDREVPGITGLIWLSLGMGQAG